MKKAISLLCLSLLCSFPALSKMSDEEARAFLESLAKPSTEKKVFYRWQSETSKNNLLEASKMNPQLYEHFMGITSGYAGSGLYVAEDILSSTQYGGTIIQVELEPGYKYLNLLDEQIQEKLSEAKLTNKDVYRLNPKVAVKFTDTYLVLKEKEGVNFKPFSATGVSIDDLASILWTKQSLDQTIKQEVLKRARKDLSSVIRTSTLRLLEKHYSKHSLKSAVKKFISSFIKTAEEGEYLLKQIKINYEFRFLKEYQEAIAKKTISLVKTAEEGLDLLSLGPRVLNEEQRISLGVKILEFDKNAIKDYNFHGYLESYEYEEVKAQFAKNKARRLNCLKKQLSAILKL